MNTSEQESRGVDLIVVVNGFPRLSETFVLHELLDLERRGLHLHLVALRRPGEDVEHEAINRLRAPVEYVPNLTALEYQAAARKAHDALNGHDPDRYRAGLAEVLASPDFSRAAFSRGAILAHRIVQLGSPPLYSHFAHKPGTCGRFAARLAGVPYALSCHAKDIWLTPAEELALKLRDAATVLTCTDENRRYLEQVSAGGTPITLVHHGVEIPTRLPPVEPNEASPVILTVGRLVEKKGHLTLLRAAAQLRQRGVDFSVRIAGDGRERAKLESLVHELSLSDRITFLGPLSDSAVREEYLRAHVFTLPCQVLPNGDRDGIPNVILEAMAFGLPIVSTTLAGVSEAVLDGECGLLVPPQDEIALADALERVLRDPDLRVRLGACARRRA